MIILSLFIPFFGTALGAGAVFFMKKRQGERVKQILCGFAAGVMMAASVWSLLLPAIELSVSPRWLQPAGGLLLGCVFLSVSERMCARLEKRKRDAKKPPRNNKMLVFAVTLHNIPEGLAVGVGAAAALREKSTAATAAALALALGIAIQNVPEGAIISLPLGGDGCTKPKAFLYGVISGAVEPVSAVLTLLFTAFVAKALPLFLSFAAGAMIYVCAGELIPDAKGDERFHCGLWGFIAGFLVMMVLDVALS